MFTTRYAKISNALAFTTMHNGPKIRSGWNLNINWHSESWVRATLVNAVVEYKRQCQRTGVQSPYPSMYWAGGEALDKLEIRAVFSQGRSDMNVFSWNRIRIYTQHSISRRHLETDELYGVTFHELTHQSHWKLSQTRMTITNPIIKESWAEFIEYKFTKYYYPNSYATSDRQLDDWELYIWDKSGGEADTEKNRWKYTALFIDLQDDYPQPTFINKDEIRPNDQVKNYTIPQLQNAVKKSHNLWVLRDYLKDTYHNSTEGHLSTLFDFYTEVEEYV